MENLSKYINNNFFKVITKASRALNYESYVIGGYVRDILLERPSNDIDIVTVGSGIELAKKTASFISAKKEVKYYGRFGTAMIRLKDKEIEFVGARRESYDPSSRKPTVENGTLEDDQNRRDFTINALAISLNEAIGNQTDRVIKISMHFRMCQLIFANNFSRHTNLWYGCNG